MLIAYIFLLRNWYRFIVKMDEAGCTIEPHTSAVSDQCLILLLAGILLVGCVCGYTFGSRYPMKWAEIDRPAGTEKTKENLKSLGFPEEVLADLTARDLSACVEATQVITEQETFDTDNHLVLYRRSRKAGRIRSVGHHPPFHLDGKPGLSRHRKPHSLAHLPGNPRRLESRGQSAGPPAL